MDDVMDEAEEKSHGLELQSAILHVLDGRRHNIVLSEGTLDLEEPEIEKYVKRYVTRCRRDMRTRPGTFHEDSAFRRELERYFRGESRLPEFSANVCKSLIEYFEQEEARSFECLVAVYRDEDVPYMAVILLEEAESMNYVTSARSGNIINTISFGNTSLPAMSKPVGSFALVDIMSQEIRFVDEGKWKDNVLLIQDRLLEADAGFSRREVVDSVKTITCEVADQFRENSTLLLSQVKNYISETVNEGMPLNTETLVEELFEEKPQMAKVFREKVAATSLPKETELPKGAVTTALRKQRIVTDTGIEITFPSEYYQESGLIEFTDETDGTITISIKGVNRVTNK